MATPDAVRGALLLPCSRPSSRVPTPSKADGMRCPSVLSMVLPRETLGAVVPEAILAPWTVFLHDVARPRSGHDDHFRQYDVPTGAASSRLYHVREVTSRQCDLLHPTGVCPARLRAALTRVWRWPAGRFRLSSVEQVPLNCLSTFEPDRMRELTKRVTLRAVVLVPSRASGGEHWGVVPDTPPQHALAGTRCRDEVDAGPRVRRQDSGPPPRHTLPAEALQ